MMHPFFTCSNYGDISCNVSQGSIDFSFDASAMTRLLHLCNHIWLAGNVIH